VARRSETPYATYVLAASFLLVAQFVTGWFPTEASIRPVAWSRAALDEGRYGTLLTSLFAHGGPLHLLGNLLTLLGLGPVFERQLGRLRFLLVYFGAGIAGNLAHVAFRPDLPVVGASGCLFGLLGVLLVLDPAAEIGLLGLPMSILLFGGLYTAAVPFLVKLGNVLPIAHEAHLGGMAFGALAAFVFDVRRAARFAPGILVVFVGIQLVLTKALTFDYAAAGHQPLRWLEFVPGLVLWIAGGLYVGSVYDRWVHPRRGGL
jgi:membrane associated rhomboid family serine protease